MKFATAVVTVVAIGLVASPIASAATLTASPAKRCYGTGEKVTLTGAGFSPGLVPPGGVVVTRDGTRFPETLSTDAGGAFRGVLTLAQRRGKRTSTYTATDPVNTTLTASTQVTVSATTVRVRPKDGPPGRRLKLTAGGFTQSKRLYAHVRKGGFKRNIFLGRLKRACGKLTTRRRILSQGADYGVYTVQFDNYRKYKPRRAVSVGFTLTVRRIPAGVAGASASTGWSQIW